MKLTFWSWLVQSLKGADAENIGYVIPTTVIHHFLSDYDTNGKYTGSLYTQNDLLHWFLALEWVEEWSSFPWIDATTMPSCDFN